MPLWFAVLVIFIKLRLVKFWILMMMMMMTKVEMFECINMLFMRCILVLLCCLVEKLNACFALLDAFGNSRTTLNTNTSNFTQISLANFNSGGQLISLSFQVFQTECCWKPGCLIWNGMKQQTSSQNYLRIFGVCFCC